MVIKNSTLISLLVLVLMAGNLFIAYKFIKFRKDASDVMNVDQAKINELHEEIEMVKTNFRQSMNWQFLYENHAVANAQLTTTEGKLVDLYSIIKSSNVLIYRITDQSCDVCYDNITKKLKEAGDTIGKENILIIIPISELRNTVSAFAEQKISATILVARQASVLGIPLESSTSPFFFVTGPTLSVSHLFVPHKNGVDITEDYFEVIGKKFFKQ